MSDQRKGHRQLAALVAELSPRDQAVLSTASDLRLVSTRQLERLHFPDTQHATPLTAARTARRVLERLVRGRLLARLERRIGGVRAGSASFIYAIGPVGERVLAENGPRRRFREPSARFVAHTLAASELYVRLHEAVQRGELKITTVESEPTCWRTMPMPVGRSLLKPDLFVEVASGDYDYRWFVEVDLGTEHAPAVIRKSRAYEAYYRSGIEQAEHGVFPRVLWVAPDDDRAGRIRRAIEASTDLTHGLFVVTTEGRAVLALAGDSPGPDRTARPGDRKQLIERRDINGTR